MPYHDHTPTYRLHRASGRAVVTIDGTDHYLGTHGTKASRSEYERLIGQWLACGRTLAPAAGPGVSGITVSELINAFRVHAQDYYRKADGTPTGEVEAFRQALKPLRLQYGTLPAAEFSPLKLEAVRNAMITTGWSRKNVNRQVGRVKQLFSWGVAKELVPGSVAHALREVKGLKRGRGGKERPRVKPVPEPAVDAVLPLVSPQIRAMIELQLLTGMRPAEVCAMRGTDLDMGKSPWVYTPAAHKTEIHDIERFIYLGPRAQDTIRPFLKTDLQAHLFAPSEAEAQRNAERRQNRQTPMTPSARSRKLKASPARPKGEVYTVASYRRCIARACDVVFPPPAPLGKADDETFIEWKSRLTVAQRAELRKWWGIHRWHPHQLRHTAATRFRREYGVDAAGVLLGHNTLAITGVYAEQDQAKAQTIMQKVG